MAIAAVTGSILGAASAPEGEKREAHAMLWGSLAASGAGLYSIEKYDDSKELEELRLEVKKAKLTFKNGDQKHIGMSDESPISTVHISEGLPYSQMPPSIRENIKPTQIKVKKVDEWRLGDRPNSHLHCETEVEFESSKIVK